MNSEYTTLLQNASSTFEALVPPKGFRFSPDESQIGLTVAPPVNCDIRFQVGKFKLVQKKFKLSKDEEALPINWQNFPAFHPEEQQRLKESQESEEEKRLKSLSIKPVNQGHCGSCFAVAIATTISDNFLFGKQLDQNPSLSPMYILSCLSKDANTNNRCNGGNPSGVVDDIIHQGGLSNNCCQDYYKICEGNKHCNGKGEEHMSITMDEVNGMIPDCGHCTDKPPKLYKVKNKTISFDVPSIKTHIKKYGAAVGGFLIFPNFMGDATRGRFEKTKGIYIRAVDYTTTSPGTQNNQQKPIGGHAISIVGWGREDNVSAEINGTTYVYPKVDYWVCRNSWTENWGDRGYFKYAMHQEYPSTEEQKKDPTFRPLPDINKYVAFETDNSHMGQSLGGILLIEPDTVVEATDKQEVSKKISCQPSYVCDLAPPPIEKKKKQEHNQSRWWFLLYIAIGVGICLLIYYLYRRGHKHGKKKSHGHGRSRGHGRSSRGHSPSRSRSSRGHSPSRSYGKYH